MGTLSKEVMKKANILPRLRLGIKQEGGGVKSTGKHHVKLLEEKLINGKDYDGKTIPMMRFVFEENGEKKRYDAPLQAKDSTDPHYFVQGMSEIAEGDEIILEMIKKGVKSVISIQKLGAVSEVETDETEDEDVIDITEDENG